MNSFKKIAIATAAALAFASFSVAPSSAAPLAVTVATVNNATTSVAPATVAVPAANQITSGTSVALAATADTATVVSFVASDTIKLVTALHTTDSPKTIASGVSTLSVTSTGAALTVYAYTTSVKVGTVTITNGAYSTIVYIKGNAGAASNVAVAVPAASAVGTIPTVTVSATDVFGNPVLTGETITATVLGSAFADGTVTKTLVTSTAAEATADTTLVAGSKTASLAVGVSGTVTVVVTGATSAATVAGLSAPVKAAQAAFTISDLNGTVATLTAQLAAEKAGRALDAQAAANILSAEKAGRAADKVASDKALADSKIASDKALADAKAASDSATVTAKAAADLSLATAAAKYKAEYNALAKKWNAKNPKAKVALKK
jgi:hypothetical protein